MSFFTDGQLVKWLIAGALWAAICWFFFAIFLVIALREVATSILVNDTATLSECLVKVAKPLRYTVKQLSPTTFECTPKNWLGRSFECLKLHVRLDEGSLELTGPAMIVKNVQKKLRRLDAAHPGSKA
jgi:hypothetical protein